MTIFEEIAAEIGETVTRKNAAYGSSFAKAGAFLQLLYPEGLTPVQYADALLLVRIFDKQMRVATDRDAFGESPWADMAGYGILGVQMHHERKEHEAWQGSVSGQNVQPSPAGPTPASAAPSTSAKTTTSANASSANATTPTPSTPPASSSADMASALAPTAMGSVLREEVASRVTDDGRCGHCGKPLPPQGIHLRKFWTQDDHVHIRFCSEVCVDRFCHHMKVRPA